MKKSLKFTALILVVSMVFAFAACSPKDNEEPTTTMEPTTEEIVLTTEEITEAEKSTLVVNVGFDFDYIPYKYKDGNFIYYDNNGAGKELSW